MGDNSTCFECSGPVGSTSVLKLKRVYCSECWIQYCQFRFRKRLFELGRPDKGTKLMDRFGTARETVLVVWTASESAWSLLHLVRVAAKECCTSSDESDPKMTTDSKNLLLSFRFLVLYIQDTHDDAIKNTELLRLWQRNTFEKLGISIPIILTSMESYSDMCISKNASQYFKIMQDFDNSCEITLASPETKQRFVQVIDSFKSTSSRNDFLEQVRRNLTVRIAKEIKATKVLLPEDQSSMAIKMFVIVSIGRGAQLAEEMGLCTELEGVKMARPLMDLTADDLKEFMTCLKSLSCDNHTVPQEASMNEKTPLKSVKLQRSNRSIHTQCEEFISDLQTGYPSTVPTLSRIGMKLRPQEARVSAETVSCEGSSSIGAAVIFNYCSLCKYNVLDDLQSPSTTVKKEIQLCYACVNLVKDTKDPSWIQEYIQHICLTPHVIAS